MRPLQMVIFRLKGSGMPRHMQYQRYGSNNTRTEILKKRDWFKKGIFNLLQRF